MGKPPVISIGMPVYNAARTLRTAVDSILQQDFADWELLIIDDGSSDGTADLARSFADGRIRVFSDGYNRGLAARNNTSLNNQRNNTQLQAIGIEKSRIVGVYHYANIVMFTQGAQMPDQECFDRDLAGHHQTDFCPRHVAYPSHGCSSATPPSGAHRSHPEAPSACSVEMS